MSDGLKWYGARVKAELRNATQEAIEKLAFGIQAGTQAQITMNDQIDTGFMRNSVYSVTKQSGVRGGAMSTGDRKSVPPARLGDADAIVGVGAEYAIYQEMKRSFLRVAFEREVTAAGGTFKRVYSSRGF